MKTLNNVTKLGKDMQLYSVILVLSGVIFGVFVFPIHSSAQAVPPRVQTQMINRPLVAPPESPVQKEIGEVKRELRATKVEMARRMEVVATVGTYNKQLEHFRKQLNCFVANFSVTEAPTNGMICDVQIPLGSNGQPFKGDALKNWMARRAQYYAARIEEVERNLSILQKPR